MKHKSAYLTALSSKSIMTCYKNSNKSVLHSVSADVPKCFNLGHILFNFFYI